MVEVDDCQSCPGFLSTNSDQDTCINRVLFHNPNNDFLWNDILAIVIWFGVAGIAIASGVGGGGIYVPLGILLLQFAPKQASGVSQASIFGASLGGYCLNMWNQHPERTPAPRQQELQEEGLSSSEQQEVGSSSYSRPLIHYDMVLFLGPSEIAGALLGILVQRTLPNWLYLLIAGIVMLVTAYLTYLKFWQVRKLENERNSNSTLVEPDTVRDEVDDGGAKVVSETDVESDEAQSDSSAPHTEENRGVFTPTYPSHSIGHSDATSVDSTTQVVCKVNSDSSGSSTTANTLQKLHYYLQRDSRQFPTEKLLGLLLLWGVLLTLTLLIGGKGIPSLIGITCDSIWYAVLLAAQFTWLAGFSLFHARRLCRQQRDREAVGYPFLAQDPQWNLQSLRCFGVSTFFAGAITGMVGVSGGMVLNPILMYLGVHPMVSSATTATTVILTSSSLAIVYVVAGLVPWSYALCFFAACMTGALVGKSQIDKYVRRTGRASLLVGILTAILAFAALGIFYNMITRLAVTDWCLDGFKQFCTISINATPCRPAAR